MTNGSRNPLSAAYIEVVPVIPEYPRTHPDGYAYIVDLQYLSSKEKKSALKHVSYLIIILVIY